ncbi:MAG: gamma carbonic anhydrase family protein [Clostridia bacterium]|nr:gamma carbonic anhydrase family protein [Clostridia bacterium]
MSDYTVRSWKDKSPVIPDSCTIFENCSIYGDVVFGENCVVMPGTVIRAEACRVIIGDNTNIQDMCCIHTDVYEGADVIIGSNVTIGHRALLHACTVEDNALIGMGAVVLNGARIGRGAMVSAGALVTQNAFIEDGMLAVGVPAKVRRAVSEAEIKENDETIEEYREIGELYINKSKK